MYYQAIAWPDLLNGFSGISPKTTFRDVQTDLVGMGFTRAMVLRTHFGPRPYWTKAEPSSLLGRTCQLLYFIDEPTSARYALCAVRDSLSDFPTVVCKRNSSSEQLCTSPYISSDDPLERRPSHYFCRPDARWSNTFCYAPLR